MQQNKVAVLMATFNGEKFVEEQIETILNQKGVSVKVFISDDGSSDKHLESYSCLEKKI